MSSLFQLFGQLQDADVRLTADNVGAETFHAAFQVLTDDDAIDVGPAETWQEAVYPGHPDLLHMLEPDHWISQKPLVAPGPVEFQTTQSGWPLEFRLTAARPERVAVPSSVRESQAIAGRVDRPFDSERTRAGVPLEIRTICRRSLHWPGRASGWRVWFVQAEISRMATTDSGLGLSHTYVVAPQAYSVVLELLPLAEEGETGLACGPGQAQEQVLWLVARLRGCLGAGRREVAEFLAEGRQRFEMSSLAL